MHFMKEKIVTSNGIKKTYVCRPEIGPKHFDKLKPEPGATRKARPDLQLCAGDDVNQDYAPLACSILTVFFSFPCWLVTANTGLRSK